MGIIVVEGAAGLGSTPMQKVGPGDDIAALSFWRLPGRWILGSDSPKCCPPAIFMEIGSAVLLTNTVRYRHDKNYFLRTLTTQGNELEQARLQLQKTKHLLASAENKLEFLNQHKTAVQVTAFIGQGRFASGLKTAQSYAVPHHILPDDKVLNVALSPTARRSLHARMNDYIVLLDNQQKVRLARFVDTTSANEIRPVVDVFFAKQEEALTFGRQHYLAVNISAQDSPFH